MNDFLKFFDKVAYKYKLHLRLHLSIAYNKVSDWGIYIYRSGRGENEKDLVIVNVSDCDMELCFARAQVQLKEWLLENEGGY